MATAEFPEGADGEVFVRLSEDGFDFSNPHQIEFIVDFRQWPPAEEAIDLLTHKYESVERIEAGDGDLDDDAYLIVSFMAVVEYDWVIRKQRELSDLVAKYDGWCDSWGVMTDG